ncbi:MAG: polyribonucleotide nucleotidyltransferase, partial [Ilumatobacteraceae bacterium]|nr:polyribonucleotide nucleotidyltransferase [Ilumatobacteraceae bacterium]
MEEAKARILAIVDPPKADVGATYNGRVVNVTKFGAFVNILPGRDGLVHISKLGKGKRINNVEDVLTLGQEIEVIVEEIDEKGKVSLTPGPSWNPFPNGDSGDGGASSHSSSSSRSSSSSSPSSPVEAESTSSGDRPVAVSFDDAFDAELAGELGDLGPGGEAGGGAAADRAGDRERGPRRDDRGARSRGPRRHR